MCIRDSREALLQWAGEEEGRYILEDDYDSEFRFQGKPVPALQGMGAPEKVVYFYTFAKSLAPSLRIGYMVQMCIRDSFIDEQPKLVHPLSIEKSRTPESAVGWVIAMTDLVPQLRQQLSLIHI